MKELEFSISKVRGYKPGKSRYVHHGHLSQSELHIFSPCVNEFVTVQFLESLKGESQDIRSVSSAWGTADRGLCGCGPWDGESKQAAPPFFLGKSQCASGSSSLEAVA